MHFDPYESKRNRRRRILSDVLILLVALAFLWGIYHVFFQTRYQLRPYTFTDATAVADADGGNAAFAALIDNVAALEEEATLSGSFGEAYPLPAAMLGMKAPYDADAPYFRFDGAHLVLAQTVISEQENERLLEILAVDVTTDETRLTLSNFRACAIAYNARTDALTYQPYDPDTFHLTLEGLTLSASGVDALKGAAIRVKSDTLTARADDLLFDETAKITLPAKSVQGRRLEFGGAAVKKGRASLTLNTNGHTFAQYAAVEIEFKSTDKTTWKFTANKSK